MKPILKAAAVAGCLAAGVVPAIATADKPANPGGKGQTTTTTTQTTKSKTHANQPAAKGKCKKPAVSEGFVASGAYTSWTGAKDTSADSKSTYSGTLTMTVKQTNHQAKSATSPFTFAHTKVTFDSPTATGPVAGDRARFIGKILVAKKGCSTPAAAATPSAGTYTIDKIVFTTAGQ